MFKINKDDYYFTDSDFDTFKDEYWNKNTRELREKRLIVQEKLLDINKDLLPLLRKNGLNLSNHYKDEFITSLTYPCNYNHFCVNWIGVRYGRGKKELKALNYNCRELEEHIRGYQKYACLQVNIVSDGVDVGIYHAVPNESVDRGYVHEQIGANPDYVAKLIEEIKKIQGLGFEWRVGNEVFDFDNQEAEDFIKFYETYDIPGTHSSLLYHFPKWDERIKEENMIESFYKKINQLYDLYQILIWKPDFENVKEN